MDKYVKPKIYNKIDWHKENKKEEDIKKYIPLNDEML